MSYGFFFFLSLLLTLIVEIPILFLLTKFVLNIKLSKKKMLYWGVFVNLFSLPYLWFVFPLFISAHNYILIGEILIILVETIIFTKAFRINLKNATILSIIANIASYLAGLIVFR